MSDLNSEKAFIFRIVHVANVAWILEHGMHCRASPVQDPNYINIGSPSLIDKRSRRVVPLAPGGTLSNYVPFYFTPFSIMMYNIHTGHGGITKRANKDIVIFVSSVHRMHELGLPYLFTNQHAYPPDTDFYSDVADLKEIDWRLLQTRNFKTDDADPGKQLRYQAESLVHDKVPLEALLGLVCHNDEVRKDLETMIEERGKNLSVKAIPNWYF
jgi:hypothetical protein